MIELEKIKEEAKTEGVGANLVLKERIHGLVLEFFFQKGFFSYLVFQGGTALRMFYGGVRYSEDLDFVLRKKSAPFFNQLSAHLKILPSFLDKYLPSREIELKTQKETLTFKRYTLTIGLEGMSAKDKTNIEIAAVPSYQNEIMMLQGKDLPLSPAVCVETLQEILSDKFCAFGSGDYVKGRDLWDIHFLLNTKKLPWDEGTKTMARKKAGDYRLRAEDFASGFKRNLAVLEKRGAAILKAEMDLFLPQAYRNAYKNRYEAVAGGVLKVLAHFYGELEKE